MGVKGFDGNLSEESKKALQSETWQKVRDSMKEKKEVKHFTAESTAENAYGAIWNQVVNEYLKSGYNAEDKSPDIVVMGETYKTLRRPEVTVFYDAAGDTLFDVTNERLEKEYEWLMNGGTGDAAENTDTKEEDDADRKGDLVVEQTEEDPEAGAAPQAERTEEEKEWPSADKTESVKPYSSGEEKLIAEENEMIASIKPEFKKIMRAQMDLLFKELISWTKQDPEFEKKVLLNHKSMKRCMKFCTDKAMGLREPSDQEKAAARNNNIPIVTPVGSNMLFEWIKEYYDKDDKAEVEKERKGATAQKKSADKKKTVEKKKAAPKETVSKKQEKKPVERKEDTKAAGSPKKQDKSVNGQISMFDLLGV